jgi:hypothetical protein
MGYWMTVYSRTDEVMEVDTIRNFFDGDDVVVEAVGEGAGWSQVTLRHPGGGRAITDVNLRVGETAAGYAAEAIENLANAEPTVNAEWVIEFLRGVKTVYSFQILSGTGVGDGWEYVRGLQAELREVFDGIMHAGAEGFCDPEGYHLTWEFSGRVSGEWWMALYDPRTARFQRFAIELGNRAHRAAFRAGRVPDGVKVR